MHDAMTCNIVAILKHCSVKVYKSRFAVCEPGLFCNGGYYHFVNYILFNLLKLISKRML